MKRLRLKTYLTVIPIVVSTALSSMFLSFYQSRSALTRVANRHLAYKAEQLRDYINNEWQVVEELGFADDPTYREAEEASFRSYARSVLRSETEEVLVFAEEGRQLFRIGGSPPEDAEDGSPEPSLSAPLDPGWFSQDLFGEQRVGIAFEFRPFAWTIAISELRGRFFSAVDGMLRKQLWILLFSVAFASTLIALYLRYIIGPLERLTMTIERMATTGDLSLRAREENQDEIGSLSTQFNRLIATVEVQRKDLYAVSQAEREAYETTRQREAETLFLLGRISDYKDEETGAHLTRIGALSGLFSRLLGQDSEEEELLRSSAPLHDIGKIGIPDSILLKPGKLTPQEMGVMQTHTTLGYKLLHASQSRYLVAGAEIAYTHHERWDASGYPRGLRGTDIPLAGRIVSIIDVFDALVSERPYKSAWPAEQALDYILQHSGTQFDPELVRIFEDNFDAFIGGAPKGEAALKDQEYVRGT